MTSKDGKTPVYTEDTPWMKWEKRFVNWFIAGVVGAMGLMALDAKTSIVVAVSAIARNDKSIEKHEIQLKDHEKQLTVLGVLIKK